MKCENNCGKEHNGEYGSGRFCSDKCARSFSTKSKRKEINKKVSQSLKGYRTIPGGKIKLCDYGCKQPANFQLNNGKWCCEDSYNKCSAIKRKNSNGLKLAHKKGIKYKPTPETIKKAVEKRKRNMKEKYSIMSWDNLPDREKRKRLLREQEYKCAICDMKNIWNNKLLIFHYDHKNGNRKDNTRENIRFICPNCHSQTSTYCRGNKTEILELDLKNELIKTNCNISKALMNLNRTAGGSNWSKAKTIINKYNLNG